MKTYVKNVNDVGDVRSLMTVEELAWGSPGENVAASELKIERRITSGQCVSLAIIKNEPVGSQFAFRFNWNGDISNFGSWDDHTACGWTDKVHLPDGNTGFLVGVGVIPDFRGLKVDHNLRWSKSLKISELLVAYTLDRMFAADDKNGPVKSVIGNARVPWYHLRPDLNIEEYCKLRRNDGLLFDPVLRFHEKMGAKLIKPCSFSMEDDESLNAGCWIEYCQPFNC